MLNGSPMTPGLYFEDGDDEERIKYQAAHHELIASALATKLAHEIDPENQIGCMFAAGSVYPYSCHPQDVFEALKKDRESYFFIDIQARGAYPSYAIKELTRKHCMPHMEDDDYAILKKYPRFFHIKRSGITRHTFMQIIDWFMFILT